MRRRHDALILAFYPHARGFSYVVFEGPLSLVDWGMSDIPAKRKTPRCLRRLSLLLDHYRPDTLVTREASQAPMRTKGLLREIEELAKSREITTAAVSREQIREAFSYLGAPTRIAIVRAIVERMPMLAPFVPPVRKIWNGEDRRMGLFDAAALTLTFFGATKVDNITGGQPISVRGT